MAILPSPHCELNLQHAPALGGKSLTTYSDWLMRTRVDRSLVCVITVVEVASDSDLTVITDNR